ncbi:putative cell cycle checkpoint protein Rad17 [Aspergillus clavatus NRRL 1]|uniref:Cell cycle checkpoint protein rad17 n=1 Tax=Aspergillus clavatus (strain ATCC 1007 / CBS 513.65 / DSM 816 / NCTC 3887 / NRRL 1 / QM 1276 / 107) TaxID=344612 RepID=A1C8D4_ASPCL|nr:cell cycle checkpoint protein rad17 [Aspergillus clavatus NRRL 1]EAW13571.1 cell cycle checkpoint protein rad17 [Aspergillus clavatus NRRL 1]
MSSDKLGTQFSGPSPYDHQVPACEPLGSSMHKPRASGAAQSEKQGLDLTEDEDDNDVIEDGYDSYDEIFMQYLTSRKPMDRVESKAISGGAYRSCRPSTKSNSGRSRGLTSNPRRFMMPPTLNSESHGSYVLTSFPDRTMKRLPWAQRYPPSNLNELAVHKRKVTEVQTWLSNAFTMNAKKLLVLRGPAGSGKTTTISLLSDFLDFDLLEWKNPPATGFSTEGYTSIAAQFDEFLSRSNRLSGLELSANNLKVDETKRTIHHPRKRIVLIEEFPAVIRLGSPSLSAFRLSLQRYLAVSSAPNSIPRSPIVIIVSDTSVDSASSYMDNLTAHRLLGVDILNHLSTTVIDFNSIAPTIMYKALELVVEKNARSSKSARRPGRNILKNISEAGDIRSAISSLEFIFVKNEAFENYARHFSAKAKRPAGRNTSITPGEEEVLKSISQREASLGLFHAVGKIIYNKREAVDSPASNSWSPQLPNHLSHHVRPGISLVSVNELLNEVGADSQTFISALHENYVPSCDGPAFLDCLNGCTAALSDSDLLCVHKKGFGADLPHSMNKATVGLDFLRQDEFSYQITARGLLFSLPSPVKRRAISTSQEGAAFGGHKIFFPSEFRLLKERAEVDDLLRLWISRSIFLHNTLNEQSTKPRTDHSMGRLTNSDAESLIITMPDRRDFLLYQLPYMARINYHGTVSCGLKKLTCFLGQNGQTCAGNDTSGLGSEAFGRFSAFSESKKNAEGTFQGKYPRIWFPSSHPIVEEKFTLSDDEIEEC